MSLKEGWDAPIEEQALESVLRTCIRAYVELYKGVEDFPEYLKKLVESLLMLVLMILFVAVSPLLVIVGVWRHRQQTSKQFAAMIAQQMNTNASIT